MKKSVFLFVVVLSVSMFSCGNAKLSPNWSSDATAEQKRILGELVESMVLVEGGTFTMGAQDSNKNGTNYDSKVYSGESPTHRVTLSDYYIGKYEVTQEQWQAVMGNNPSEYKGNRKPVEKVSWNECQEFVRKLQALTGLKFVLPTEAQWEYAARGGNKSQDYKYSGGNDLFSVGYFRSLYKYGTYDDDKGNSDGEVHPVGQKSPNELGLYDMSGNVAEWCQDWYEEYSRSSQTDPIGPTTGSCRVLRGGSAFVLAECCRVFSRNYGIPGYHYNYCGLRLAINPQ